MIDFKSEQQMFDTMRDKLYAAVISDVLDRLSAREQAMRADICPVYPGAVVVGRAYTVMSVDIFEVGDDPYRGFIEAVDSLKANDVLVFATGRKPVDSAGRSIAIDHGCPVSCGDVLVHPGDIVFGDIDGVVVIPKELEKEVISLALEKAEKENLVRDELLKGTLVRDAYAKHKVL